MGEHEGSHAKTDFGRRELDGWAMGWAVSGDGAGSVGHAWVFSQALELCMDDRSE